MVVPQRVPDAYVKAAVDSMEDRLQTISQHILSRSRLERIIVDLGLYEDLRRTEVMEDVVQRMRRDIDIPPIGKADTSFRVTYVSRDAKTAQEVTTRLASLFIEENMRERENLAEDTNQFLDSQLEDARRRLIENEKKLESYRRQYSGQLPSQAPTNLQAIQNTQQQLQSLSDAMNREREHRLLVERQLVDLESPDPILAATTRPGTTAPTDGLPGESTARQLEAARARLQRARNASQAGSSRPPDAPTDDPGPRGQAADGAHSGGPAGARARETADAGRESSGRGASGS